MSLPIETITPAWGATYVGNLQRALASAGDAAARTVIGDAPARQQAETAGATQILDLETKTPGHARAQGLASATEPYVLFLDADDELLPGGLEKLYTALVKDSRAIGAAGYFIRSADGALWPKPLHARIATSIIGPHALLFRNMLPANGSILLRREMLQAIPGQLLSDFLDEDWHTVLKIRLSGRVRFIREPVYKYNVIPGSVSRSPRDITAVNRSHNALITTAEQTLGRHAPTLRLAEKFIRPRREKRDAAKYADLNGQPNLTEIEHAPPAV